MAHGDREQFIPLRVPDLLGFLAHGRGALDAGAPLTEEQQTQLRRLAQGLVRYFHRDFNARFQKIKDAYAPFDPDRDTVDVVSLNAAAKQQAVDNLFAEMADVLAKANYRELSRQEAAQIMKGASFWGLDLDVEWSVFERILIFHRGDSIGRRTLRRWWKFWKREEKLVPEFNRLVIVLKQNAHRRLGKNADTQSVFMKIFKDMPKVDLEMVLPGTRIRLTKLDHGLIFYPVMSGIALLLYKLLSDWIGFRDILAIGASVSLSWSLAGLFAGYGWRSYVRYTGKKTAYALLLTQSLYIQAIDGNAGVVFRVLDEAEEQEVREALLGYFYLWQGARPMTAAELDDTIERDLERRLNLKIDFECADALAKLEELHLIEREGALYRAVPIERASAATE